MSREALSPLVQLTCVLSICATCHNDFLVLTWMFSPEHDSCETQSLQFTIVNTIRYR
jgi:hypothetical protein